MPDSSGYEVTLSSRSTSALIVLPKSKQRKIINLLFRLAAYTHQLGDYSTRGEDGRDIQHLRLSDVRISFWADDAVREVRVVDIAKL